LDAVSREISIDRPISLANEKKYFKIFIVLPCSDFYILQSMKVNIDTCILSYYYDCKRM